MLLLKMRFMIKVSVSTWNLQINNTYLHVIGSYNILCLWFNIISEQSESPLWKTNLNLNNYCSFFILIKLSPAAISYYFALILAEYDYSIVLMSCRVITCKSWQMRPVITKTNLYNLITKAVLTSTHNLYFKQKYEKYQFYLKNFSFFTRR